MRSLSRLPRRSNLRRAAAALRAVAAAVALLGLPYATLGALDGARWSYYVPLAVDLLALVALAIWLWSPLTVLGAALLAYACAVLYFLGVAATDTCGDSTGAEIVEWVGAGVLAIPIATWAVRGGAKFIWRFPLAWLTSAIWVISWAHVLPGAAGGCFE